MAVPSSAELRQLTFKLTLGADKDLTSGGNFDFRNVTAVVAYRLVETLYTTLYDVCLTLTCTIYMSRVFKTKTLFFMFDLLFISEIMSPIHLKLMRSKL